MIHCFLEQDYPAGQRELIVLDDAGQYENQSGPGWRLVSTAQRFPTLGEKRNAAAALAGAVESRDPVIAMTAAAEVSPEMVTLAGHAAEGRAFIFPLVVRQRVPVLLYCWGPVQGPALEMLAQVAAAVWDSLAPPEASPLVTIAPAAPAEPGSAEDTRSAKEQALHLRAHRFARVRVAEIRLHNATTVQSGRTQRNLYEALRAPIDGARETFRHLYLAPCPGMVDYFHVELVRTLAHEDPDLLGKDYPGPLV